MPEMLANAVPEPEIGGHVWEYYCQIRKGMAAKDVQPMRAQDVQDFCWFYGVSLELWERIALKRIDAVFMGG